MQTAEKQVLYDAAKPGDIFFSGDSGWTSKAIRYVLNFEYSHVFVKLDDKYIIESALGGVRINAAKKHITELSTYFEFLSLPDKLDRDKFLALLKEDVGKDYDYWLILGAIVSRIIRRHRQQKGLADSLDKLVCSELIAKHLQNCDYKLPYPPSQMTPEDLYYLLRMKKER